jgi:hypothetical protein
MHTLYAATLMLDPPGKPMSQPAAIEPSPKIIIPDPSIRRPVDPLDR